MPYISRSIKLRSKYGCAQLKHQHHLSVITYDNKYVFMCVLVFSFSSFSLLLCWRCFLVYGCVKTCVCSLSEFTQNLAIWHLPTGLCSSVHMFICPLRHPPRNPCLWKCGCFSSWYTLPLFQLSWKSGPFLMINRETNQQTEKKTWPRREGN